MPDEPCRHRTHWLLALAAYLGWYKPEHGGHWCFTCERWIERR